MAITVQEGRLSLSWLEDGNGMEVNIVTETQPRHALMAVLSSIEAEALANHIQTRAPWRIPTPK